MKIDIKIYIITLLILLILQILLKVIKYFHQWEKNSKGKLCRPLTEKEASIVYKTIDIIVFNMYVTEGSKADLYQHYLIFDDFLEHGIPFLMSVKYLESCMPNYIYNQYKDKININTEQAREPNEVEIRNGDQIEKVMI